MKLSLIIILTLLSQLTALGQNTDLPNKEKLTKEYLDAITKREIGQTAFAVKSARYAAKAAGSRSMSADAAGGGREIQESDVFKIGKEGEKELFLLNTYRGFQVVSFKDGIDKPKIAGRFPVYNNWSSEMYYLESKDQVIVLNTEWVGSEYSNSNYQTILYLIDVKDTSQPKLINSERIQGYLRNSRLVGDVLYAITTGSNGYREASITSLKIKDGDFDYIASTDLHGNNRWVETMNVFAHDEKFYVVSTLSNWRGTGDYVNVHDITDPNGKIVKIMTAKARGRIQERSQTFMKGSHLFMVSNYRKDEKSKMRVSVEAVEVKTSTEVVISEEKNRISTGDTNGQHASLQDVRVSGDLLYVFWVPANNIDPFDLFDLSNLENGIKHLGQLQFEGWISKAFPINYKDKKFVLGLGWIVPATNEDNIRYPQAKLFEIVKGEKGYEHQVVASLTIDSDRVWASLNAEDKFFEIMNEGDGKYNIMFPVTFRPGWKDGAKIVNLDVNHKSLTAGASIIADQSWLKRVFRNKELKTINTFSNKSLATFDNNTNENGISEAVSILELARNIVDFHVIDSNTGLQLITNDKNIELRKVSLTNVDAEKNDTLSSTKVDGEYGWHKFVEGKLYLVTNTYREVERTSGNYKYKTNVLDKIFLNIVELNSFEITKSIVKTDNKESYYSRFSHLNLDNADIFNIDGKIYELSNNSMNLLKVEDKCQYFFNDKDDRNRTFSIFGTNNKFFAYNELKANSFDEEIKHGDNTYTKSHVYKMPYVKELSILDGEIKCSESINVPGKPYFSRNDLMLTEENSYYGWRGRHSYNYSYSGRGYYGRNLDGKTYAVKKQSEQTVELTDILNKNIKNGVYGDNFLTYNSNEARFDLWSVTETGELLSRPRYLGYDFRKSSQLIAVKSFNNRDFIFINNEKKITVLELTKSKYIDELKVTSTVDLNLNDGKGEYIFGIDSIIMNEDGTKFIISQGNYGVSELIIQ